MFIPSTYVMFDVFSPTSVVILHMYLSARYIQMQEEEPKL